MTIRTSEFDSAAVLDTLDAIETYLSEAFETGDPSFIAFALGVVARAKGMSQLADETGLSRPALYKALSSDGNPEFSTIIKVAHALGFALKPERLAEEA